MAIHGITVPDAELGREITELVRDSRPPLLFHHSSGVFHWGALTGARRGMAFDAELLYACAMFYVIGLTRRHGSPHERFEVDGANWARDFLRGSGISQHEFDTVWTAIALHNTPGIPKHMHSVVALATAGVEMVVLGVAYHEFSAAERESVVRAHPRPEHFKDDIIQALYIGIRHKPNTTFGNVKADVPADKVLYFRSVNFCSVIRSPACRA
jgi:hypothetical protein